MDRQWAFQGRAVDDEIISIIPLYGLRCKNLSRYFDDNTMAIFFHIAMSSELLDDNVRSKFEPTRRFCRHI